MVGEDEKGRGMVGQRKKLDGLGIFGGSGEGMYYGVFGLVAYAAWLKPPPARQTPPILHKGGLSGGARGERERPRRDTDNIIYRGHRIRQSKGANDAHSHNLWIITIIPHTKKSLHIAII